MNEHRFAFSCKLTKKTGSDAFAGKYKLAFWNSYLEVISLVASKYKPPLKFTPDHEKDLPKIGTQYGLIIVENQAVQTDYRHIFKTCLEYLFARLEYAQKHSVPAEQNLLLLGMRKAIKKSSHKEFSDREIIKINKIEDRVLKLAGDYRQKYTFNITVIGHSFEKSFDSTVEPKASQLPLIPGDAISPEATYEPTLKKNIRIEYQARLVLLSVVSTTASEFAIDGTGTKKFYLDMLSQKAVEEDIFFYKNRDLTLRVVGDPSAPIKTVMIID